MVGCVFAIVSLEGASADLGHRAKANELSIEQIEASVQPKLAPLARAIFSAGGFQGFQAAPGCSMAPSSDSLYDFLVQNVAVDANDRVIDRNPLTAVRQRDVRPGDLLPYVMCDYPRAGEQPGRAQRQHRYAVPFAKGTDQTGATDPIVLGWRDLTPRPRSDQYGTFGPRDIASMVGVFPRFGCYMGAFIPKKGYVVSLGPGYADESTKGMARFAHPLFPNPLPVLGSMWRATILQKIHNIGTSQDIDALPAHAGHMLVPQLTIGKRLMYTYGTRTSKTRSLDTVVVVLAYNNPNVLGDAPEINDRSAQFERIYLTKEFGYGTRWELWGREDSRQKEVIAKARQAYAYNDSGMPASMEGTFSKHFIVGPVIEDAKQRVYKQQQTVVDPETGQRETTTWYMIGCHDYTNVQPQKPAEPAKMISPSVIGAGYMKLFGVPLGPR